MEPDSEQFKARMDAQLTADTIPIVDPEDLKHTWAMLDDIKVRNPGQNVAIGASVWKSACSPGADTQAVFLRVSMLQTLKRFSETTGHVFPWLHDGKPDDAMFELFALGRLYQNCKRY